MSRKKPVHRTSVRKSNPFGTGRMWWLRCSCGYFQGWHSKVDALECERTHLESVRSS